MTQKAKAEQIAAWLAQVSERSRFSTGRPYGDDVQVVGRHVVVATLDPGKEYNAPLLVVYTFKQAAAWHDQIVECMEELEADLAEAVMETMP